MTTVRIADFATVIRGVSWDKSEASDTPRDGYLPILRAGSIGDALNTDDDLVWVPSSNVSAAQRILAGDIAICMSSGSASVVGKSAAAKTDWLGSVGAFCALLRADANKCLPEYLGFYLKSSWFRRWTSEAQGANIKNIRKSALEDFSIPLPSLPEQRRIIDLLSRAEGIVRLRREAEKKAAELIPALFLDMFGDPATNPKGWDKKPMTAVCDSSDDIKCGPFGTQLAKSEFRRDGVPLWGIRHVNVGFSIPTHEFLSMEKAAELSAYSILPGDIVMTRKGTIGNCALYREGMPNGVMHSDLLRIRPNPSKCEAQFLSDQLHISRDVEHQIARNASSGAVMPGINVGRLKAVQILVPPINIQKVTFSNRSAMSYDDLRHYLGHLRETAEAKDVRVDWNVVRPERVKAVNHDQLAGLQIADAVASGIYFAVNLSQYGEVEDR